MAEHPALLDFNVNGLTQHEAGRRLQLRRKAEKVPSQWQNAMMLFFRQFKNPLVMLLAIAVIIAAALGDLVNSMIVMGILLMTGVLGFWQEYKAERAADKLRAFVKCLVWVCRDGVWAQIPQSEVVEGDIIRLSAGDMIPGDCLLLGSTDLYVNEAALTGESFPVEKEINSTPVEEHPKSDILFQGTNVVSGIGTALVTKVGVETQLGRIAHELQAGEASTAFERGVGNFGYLLIRLTLFLAIGILIFNILLGRPTVESVFFALALAVGMAPELLPAIMVTTLSSGALRMARQKVVIKKLAAIQNLGAINILCSDKTGTLTEGIVKVHATLDWAGQVSEKVRLFAYLNAFFESGFTNPIDQALRSLSDVSSEGYSKVDEVPYDFIRKRLSVVVEQGGQHWMITKGALQNVLEICQSTGDGTPIESASENILHLAEEYSREGYRVLGLACRDVSGDPQINRDDEREMTFLGFILLYDPPKADVVTTIAQLEKAGVHLKIISGDSKYAVRHMAECIGLSASKVLTGQDLQETNDEALPALLSRIQIFAEVEPHQKERIIRALRANGHIVGYLGDGINDAPALKAADVGISVDSGVDVAKAAADIVLLDKNFNVLLRGILEGRRTFANTLKYIFITTSANFGNMFSLAGVSLLIPYLPLLPKQVLLLNFISDLPALFIASDRVDDEMVQKPRKWDIALIRRFMFVFGVQSSLFDFLTFGLLLFIFKVKKAEFQTAWFIESVITEVLILLIVRTTRPAWRSRPSRWLLLTGVGVIAAAMVLPYLPFARLLGFCPLPAYLLAVLAGIAVMYGLLSEYVKGKFWAWSTGTGRKRPSGSLR